jgi:rhodanese-related sulfurtransferase
MQDNPDALLIDMRDSAQANADSIPGAINID